MEKKTDEEDECPNCKLDTLGLKNVDTFAIQNFIEKAKHLNHIAKKSYRPIEIHENHRTLYEALIFPEISKGIKFPTEFMSIPTFTHQIKNSFVIKTNSQGNAWIEFNFGQYLDESRFKDGVNNKNGNSNIGNSNLFICNDESLDGETPISSNATICVPNKLMVGKTGLFNAIRPGPTSVKYEYTGRLDIASGQIMMGVNYSTMSDPDATIMCNGLLPDTRYSTIGAVEDCPFMRNGFITDTLKAVFVPHDTTTLFMKSPTDDINTTTIQRLFIMITSAPKNQIIGRIYINQNWEGTPTADYSDILSLTYNTFPSEFNGKDIYDYIITNNLIITKNDDEYGIDKFSKIYEK